MLTINYNGKTFRWIGDKWGVEDITEYDKLLIGSEGVYFFRGKGFGMISLSTNHTPEQLVKLGYMEEVEEKTEEPIDTYIKREIDKEDERIRMRLDNAYEVTYANPSILEKLREALYKMKSEHEDESTDEFDMGVVHTSQYILDLLTSLEKEEPENIHIKSNRLHCPAGVIVRDGKVQPQFTPGQEDKIEPELPEVPDFESPKHYISENIYSSDAIGVQVEALTKAYQTLARQKTNK